MKSLQAKVTKKLTPSVSGAAVIAALTGLLGIMLLLSGRAAGPFVAAEAENGTLTGTAQKITDTTASGGAAVAFTDGGTFDPTSRLWTGDFETGNPNQWTNCQNKYINAACSSYSNTQYPLMVQSSVKRQGNYAARFELHQGDTPFGGTDRTEVAGDTISGGTAGQDLWYQWSTMFDQQFPTNFADQGWGVVGQWHDEGNGSPPISMNVDVGNGQWGVRVSKQSSPGVYVTTAPIWVGPLSNGAWHDVKFHIKWSTDNTVGFIEFWHNGVQQTFTGGSCVGKTRCYIQTMTPGGGNTLYYKQGIYTESTVQGTKVVYFDGYVVAKTEAGLGAPNRP